MNKITMGRTRKKSKEADAVQQTENAGHAADAVFILGAAAVCVMLAVPMLSLPLGESSAMRDEAAVTVMSSAIEVETSPKTEEREELVAPSNAKTEEWSFYDYIGELFAGLISGQ